MKAWLLIPGLGELSHAPLPSNSHFKLLFNLSTPLLARSARRLNAERKRRRENKRIYEAEGDKERLN